MKKRNALEWIVLVLVLVGALNWGLVGIGNFAGGNWDLVNLILGAVAWLRDAVYIVVGLAAAYMIYQVATE
jgi:uncharacterized membrane protein YuzA (DUF378 family)